MNCDSTYTSKHNALNFIANATSSVNSALVPLIALKANIESYNAYESNKTTYYTQLS